MSAREWRQVPPNGAIHHPNRACTNDLCRPVAVIDPNSPQDQRRLLDLLRSSGAFRGVVSQDIALDCIGDALRQFANPPELAEPQGLGAVVEDTEGQRYTQVGVGCWVARGLGLEGYGWGEIAVVRVLSEGVSS